MKRIFLFLLSVISLLAHSQPLFPPTNLTSEVENQDVMLYWEVPDTTISETLTYSTGVNNTAIGLGGGGTFAVAARWEPQQLLRYDGMPVTKVTIFIADEFTDLKLKIWKGSYADSLAYYQDVDEIQYNTFFDVVLDMPYEIDATDELWIGYEITHADAFFPAGIDDGPVVAGYGDMLYYMDEWLPLSDFGFDANWNIIAHVDASTQQPLYSGLPVKEEFNFKNSGAIKSMKTNERKYQVQQSKSADLLGYNIYRDDEKLNDSPVAELMYTDLQVGDGLYLYSVTAQYSEGESLPITTQAYLGEYAFIIDPESIEDSLHINESGQYILQVTNNQDISITWNMEQLEEWLFVYPMSGVLDAGETTEIGVHVFNYSLEEGTFTDSIEFFEIEAGYPLASVPVTVTLTGGPFLSVWPQPMHFGDIYYGREASQYISIANHGNDTLIIENIMTSNSAISFDNLDLPLVLAPFDHQYSYITVTAQELGEFNEEITFYSNDANNPELSIPLNAMVTLEPPVYLLSSIDSTGVNLWWDMAINFNENWFGWSQNQNYSAFGTGDEGVFYAASRFYPEDFDSLNGKSLSKVAFFPYGQNSTYTIHVWQGDENTDPWISQDVIEYQPFIWNSVDLETPISISDEQQLWIVIEVNNAEWEYPLGVDIGPAEEGKGDLISTGNGWESMGWSVNWNIKGYVTDTETGITAPFSENRTKLNRSTSTAKIKEIPVKLDFNQKSADAGFIGYNIYRDGEQLNDQILTMNDFTDMNAEDGIYEYGVSAVYELGESEATTTMVQTALPGIVFTPEIIMGNVNSGETATFDFTITNDGEIDLEYSSNFSYFFTVTPSMGVIAPGETAELQLTVDATYYYPGPYYTDVVFEINNINEPYVHLPIEIMISGEGSVQVESDSLDFGMTLPGNTVMRYVELSNPGNGYAYVESMTTNNDEFQVYSYGFYLYPNETYNLPVYFTPGEAGEYTDQLVINTYGDSEIVVELYGQGVLAPPMGLSAMVDSTSVMLDWISPDGTPDGALQYSDNQPYTGLGYSDGGSFTVAAKFTQQELMNYPNRYLTHIGFFTFTDGADYTIKAWSGENGENLILQVPVTEYISMEWNDIALDAPISLMEFDNLYIGYEVSHPEFTYPVAIDGGPAVAGKGDLISIEDMGWESMAEMYGLNYNFMIRGLTSLDSLMVNYEGKSPKSLLAGYNVYRNGDKINGDGLIYDSQYIDFDLNPGTYSYEVTAVYDDGESPAAGPVVVDFNSEQSLPPGWNYTATDMTHTIFIPGEESKMTGAETLEEGDYIGIFFPHNGEEICAGVMMWENKEMLKIIAFGDDPATTQKEGFTDDELMHWRVYKHQTGQVYHVDVDFSHDMPQYDGNFHMLGLSMISNMAMDITSVNENELGNLSVYPIPAKDFVYINGLEKNTLISIINNSGQTVRQIYSGESSTVKFDLTGLNGIYMLRFQNGKKVSSQRIIVQ